MNEEFELVQPVKRGRGRPRKMDIQPGMQKNMAAAFNSGDRSSRELASWRPNLSSADQDMLPEKDLTEARALDLTRNNGYASGAVATVKDKIVGHRFRLVLTPEYRAIGASREAVREWAKMVEGYFHSWADDPACNVDAQRKRTFTEMLRDAEACRFVQGEAFISREWRFQPQSQFGTCFQLIEPERVAQPSIADPEKTRAGIEFDRYGAATAYHIMTRHPSDYSTGIPGAMTEWQRVPKYNRYGWLQMIHVFEQTRANQSRGFSKFASIVKRLKMMDRHESVTLELSIVAAALAVVIESQFGAQSGFEAIGASPMQGMQEYMGAQAAFKNASPVMFDGVKIPHLFPGEKLNISRAEPPGDQFQAFEEAMLRHMARGLGTSYESLSGDYSKTSYSSARAALAEAWGAVLSAREFGPSKIANQMFGLWLDEAITRQIIPLPAGVTIEQYQQNKQWFKQATWIGAGRMPIDELKSAKANEILLATNQTTLAMIAADQGLDYEDLLEQRAEERRMEKDLGIESPEIQAQQQAASDALVNAMLFENEQSMQVSQAQNKT